MITTRQWSYIAAAGALALVFAGGAVVVRDIRHEVRKSAETAFWLSVRNSNDTDQLASYLEAFPDGQFANIARLQVVSQTQAAGSGGADAQMVEARRLGDEAARAERGARRAKDDEAENARLAEERQKTHAQEMVKLGEERRKFDEAERAKLAERRQSDDRTERTKLGVARSAEDEAERGKLAETRRTAQPAAPAAEAKPAAVAAATPAKPDDRKPVPAAIPAPDAAVFLVVSSTAEGLKKGDAIQGGQVLFLPAGTRLVLLDGGGKVLTLRGPYSGTPSGGPIDNKGIFGTGALGKLFGAVREQGAAPNRGLGAFRSIGAGLGQAESPSGISVNISSAESATYCVPKGQNPVLFASAPDAGKLTVKAVAGGASAALTWPKTGNLPWPAGVPIKDGASYQLIDNNGATQTVKLHVVDDAPQSGQRALWLAERGCLRQAVEAAERLEREGGSQGLFDLELRTTNKPSPNYRIGESLELSVRSTRDAFLYCFYVDVGGEVTKIFPSQFEAGAKVDSVVAQAIPGAKWSSPMLLTGPVGSSEVRCFATDRDATAHLPAEIGKPGFVKLSETATANLMETFLRVPEANVATAGIIITVQ